MVVMFISDEFDDHMEMDEKRGIESSNQMTRCGASAKIHAVWIIWHGVSLVVALYYPGFHVCSNLT